MLKLQSFLLSLLLLSMFWSQCFSAASCKMANWWGTFDHKGWSTCDSSTEYIKGLEERSFRRWWDLLIRRSKVLFSSHAIRKHGINLSNGQLVGSIGWVSIGFPVTTNRNRMEVTLFKRFSVENGWMVAILLHVSPVLCLRTSYMESC